MKLNINDEQGIEILHFIFEREFKPPFRNSEKNKYGVTLYYNRNNEHIGWLVSANSFVILHNPFVIEIGRKICVTFGLHFDDNYWWFEIKPYLMSWMEEQLNINLNHIR